MQSRKASQNDTHHSPSIPLSEQWASAHCTCNSSQSGLNPLRELSDLKHCPKRSVNPQVPQCQEHTPFSLSHSLSWYLCPVFSARAQPHRCPNMLDPLPHLASWVMQLFTPSAFLLRTCPCGMVSFPLRGGDRWKETRRQVSYALGAFKALGCSRNVCAVLKKICICVSHPPRTASSLLNT